MGMDIYLKTGELSSGLLRKAARETESAYEAANDCELGHGWEVGGSWVSLYPSEAETAIVVAEQKLKYAHEKLEKLARILDSGPDALADIDASSRKAFPNGWQRVWSGIAAGVGAIGGAIGGLWDNLFTQSGGKTGGATDVSRAEKTTEKKSEYDLYREKVDNINKAVPVGEVQHYQGDVGQCTWVATTTLIKRKRAGEGKSTDVTCTDLLNHGGGFTNSRKFTYEGEDYQVRQAPGPYNEARYMELLNEHPEGIIIYDYRNGHAMVITDYEVDANGGVIFYADDGVNNLYYEKKGRMPWNETWYATEHGANLDSPYQILYIE